MFQNSFRFLLDATLVHSPPKHARIECLIVFLYCCYPHLEQFMPNWSHTLFKLAKFILRTEENEPWPRFPAFSKLKILTTNSHNNNVESHPNSHWLPRGSMRQIQDHTPHWKPPKRHSEPTIQATDRCGIHERDISIKRPTRTRYNECLAW